MDDLRYLAKYSPECFEKTCRNVIYNLPEAKPVMESPAPPPAEELVPVPETTVKPDIDHILTNIRHLDENPYIGIDAEQVKSLLGNLYMELLFPHNDRDTFFSLEPDETRPLFDRRV